MAHIWVQLILMSGVLGMVIMGTYYYWHYELLCVTLADDRLDNINHPI